MSGALDLAMVNLPINDQDVVVERLFEEDLIVVAPSDHPLARIDEVTLADLASHELLLTPPGTSIRVDLDRAAAAAGVKLRAKAELDGLRLIASLTFEGYGAAVLPSSAVPAWLTGDWRRVPVRGLARPVRRAGPAPAGPPVGPVAGADARSCGTWWRPVRSTNPGSTCSRGGGRPNAGRKSTVAESITITDNRTGESVEVPIVNGGVDATSWQKLLPGIWFYDPAMMTTAVTESSITELDGDAGILRYRGYPIEQLAEHSTYLEVDLPPPPRRAAQQGAARRVDATTSPTTPSSTRTCASGSWRASTTTPTPWACSSRPSPRCRPSTPTPRRSTTRRSGMRQIIRLIAKMPTLAACAYRFSVGHAVRLPRQLPRLRLELPVDDVEDAEPHFEPDPILARALDVLFILHADHEQNCSTTAMRVVGSVPRRPVLGRRRRPPPPSTGPATAAPTRRSSTCSPRSARSTTSTPSSADVKAGRGRLKGFGHRVYKNYDPRARIIKQTADEVFAVTGKNPLLDIALKLEEVALADEYFTSRKLYPNVDFYSGLIYQAMGFPIDMFTVLFAIPRTSGWLAHWQELLEQDQKIARPRQLYTGVGARDYVSLEDRKSAGSDLDLRGRGCHAGGRSPRIRTGRRRSDRGEAGVAAAAAAGGRRTGGVGRACRGDPVPEADHNDRGGHHRPDQPAGHPPDRSGFCQRRRLAHDARPYAWAACTSMRILPTLALSPCGGGPRRSSSRRNRRSITGRSAPASNSGSTSRAKRWVMAIFSSSGRARSTVPMRVGPLGEQGAEREVALALAHHADLDDAPAGPEGVDVAGEVVAADDVEHHVDAERPGHSLAAATKSSWP